MRIGVVMDPIEAITPYKDTTLAMMLAAQKRQWEIIYLTLDDLHLEGGRAYGNGSPATVFDNNEHWYELGEKQTYALGELDIIIMRKDPPFNQQYIYSTFILERAEEEGCLVANRPAALRNANEKLFISWFNDCCTETTVDRAPARLKAFLQQHQKIVVKPLDGMGGESIFVLTHGDPNTTVILDTMTRKGSEYIMAQKFLPEIADGDKRILMINGKPVDYALARIPSSGETRGNLAAGGRGVGQPLSDRDRWICEQVAPTLIERGLWFVGLDVIGDSLTEINVTSPTCVRELDAQFGLDIAGDFMDFLEQQCNSH